MTAKTKAGCHNELDSMDYSEDWDLTTIPKDKLFSEVRRRQAKAPRPGRRVLRDCPYCGQEMATVELNAHKPVCLQNPRVQRVLAAQQAARSRQS
jgi:hypothetical protein